MRVLQIASSFAINRLYSHLFKEIENHGIRQVVYSAVRTANEASFQSELINPTNVHLRHILGTTDRLLFRRKIKRITRDLQSQLSIQRYDLIHAHTLYSDGAVAYTLHRDTSIPYIISVRKTDLYYFQRFRPDLRVIRNAILLGSSAIIVLTPTARSKLLEIVGARIRPKIKNRIEVVPNGLTDQWFNNSAPISIPANTIRLLFVGTFDKCKNIMRILNAVEKLSKDHAVRLTLVGGGGEHHNNAISSVESNPSIQFLGRINDDDQLRRVYQQHDVLVMPSFPETFGLVYIEAMSQGLPVVHAAGEGIDGYFGPNGVAEAVDHRSVSNIANGILRVYERRDSVREECIRQAAQFTWKEVAATHARLYGKVESGL